MFNNFEGVWTPVLGSSELPAGHPIGIRLAGLPLALFRDSDGRPAALLDCCPHRGVALSLGRLRAGHLACPFHGWEFDGSGANCLVPWNSDARRERLCATAFPARELGGQVWVYTGEAPPGEPETDERYTQEHTRVSTFTTSMDTHWTRVMENMLDWPHLPFVHHTTIGRSMVESARRGRMDIDLQERPYGFTTKISIDGVEQSGRLDYRFPNVMVLYILSGRLSMTMQVACVPETDSRTRLVISTARNFLRSPVFDPIFHWQNRKIVMQDKAIVESSWPVEVPEARQERSVRTDAPPLRFRKVYFQRLKQSSGDFSIPIERLRSRAGAPQPKVGP
jgi:nitrite reductase/ring-hydroxylating ferredoxin subunit